MKHLAAVLAVVALSGFGTDARSGTTSGPSTQDPGKEREAGTRMEAFLAKKGSLLVKEFYEIGEVKGTGNLTLTGLVAYEPGQEARKIRGLKIEVKEAGRLEREHSSFLDLDEVDSLEKGLAYMLELSEKWKGVPRSNTEVEFSTKGGFKVGFYQNGVEQGAYARSGTIGGSTCFLGMSDLIPMRDAVHKTSTLLAAK